MHPRRRRTARSTSPASVKTEVHARGLGEQTPSRAARALLPLGRTQGPPAEPLARQAVPAHRQGARAIHRIRRPAAPSSSLPNERFGVATAHLALWPQDIALVARGRSRL